jgi:hypothetical protein
MWSSPWPASAFALVALLLIAVIALQTLLGFKSVSAKAKHHAKEEREQV